MKNIIKYLEWYIDYYLVYFLYKTDKIDRYYQYLNDKWDLTTGYQNPDKKLFRKSLLKLVINKDQKSEEKSQRLITSFKDKPGNYSGPKISFTDKKIKDK